MLRKKSEAQNQITFDEDFNVPDHKADIGQMIQKKGEVEIDRQKELFRGSSYVAAPGTSEHQSGLALDLSSPSVQMKLTEKFGDTPEGRWLASHAPFYGFILRYPFGKEDITRYPYEPWHIRFVTRTLAIYLTKTGMTLDEYYTIQKKDCAMTV